MKSLDNNGCFEILRLFLGFFFAFCLFLTSYAQEAEKIPLTYRSSLAGIGNTSVYDSYLSPLKYSGWNVGWIEEQVKITKLFDGKVSAQHLLNVEMAMANNPSRTATDYAGNLEYNYGLHYRFQPAPPFQVFAGLQAGGLVGFVYNSRNGNNPVNLKVDAGLSLSGMVNYRFQIKQQPVRIRYQLHLPFAGCLFSPEYGQSYYEIGLGDGKTVFYFASFHNRLAARSLLSVELPFNVCTLRLAYQHWFYETQVNDLDTRLISHSIYVGVSKTFYTVPDKKQPKNKYQRVFD